MSRTSPLSQSWRVSAAPSRSRELSVWRPLALIRFTISESSGTGEQGSRSLEDRPSLIQDWGRERKTAQFLGTTGLPGALARNPSAAGKIDFIGGDEVAG